MATNMQLNKLIVDAWKSTNPQLVESLRLWVDNGGTLKTISDMVRRINGVNSITYPSCICIIKYFIAEKKLRKSNPASADN